MRKCLSFIFVGLLFYSAHATELEERIDADPDATTDSKCPGHNEYCSAPSLSQGSFRCCNSGYTGEYLYCKKYISKPSAWKKGYCGSGKFCYQVTYSPYWQAECAKGPTS